MEIRVNKGKVKFVSVDDNGQDEFFTEFGHLKGKSKWAKILAPDEYGNYAVDVYPDAEDLAHYKEKAEAIVAEAKELLEGVGKKVAGEADVLKEFEGIQYVQFKRKAEKGDGSSNTPPKVYNVYGKHDPDWDKLIGNDSVVKVGYMLTPYYMASTKMVGVSAKFYAIQVIDLVEYSAGGGGDAGFGDESSGDAPFTPDSNEEF